MKRAILIIGVLAAFSCQKERCYNCVQTRTVNLNGVSKQVKQDYLCGMTANDAREYEIQTSHINALFTYKTECR